jgi:subtilase family serine protease
MLLRSANLRLFLSSIVAVVLAGCSGMPRLCGPVPQTMANGVSRCAQPRVGDAQCSVRIERAAANPDVAGWAPADFQARYRLPSSSKGAGQIVGIVDAYDNPNVASDLAKYRSQFSLGAANFTKYNQTGQQGNYPSANTAWGLEIDLDAEMVSATCPLCTIDLIEASSAGTSDLGAAVQEAVKLGARIVSVSWGCGSPTCVSQKYFRHKGVEYLAASGTGGSGSVDAPAAFDTVAAIGGTVLSKNGSEYSETAWSGSTGGCATGVKKPSWEHDAFCSYRLANDAAAVASNVAAYDSYGYPGWLTVGGTSVPTPLLAGVFGLAGNAKKQAGGRTFWQASRHQDLYPISGCSGYGYGQYTTCTGWGSPNGIGAF